jgi:hypothetical protein
VTRFIKIDKHVTDNDALPLIYTKRAESHLRVVEEREKRERKRKKEKRGKKKRKKEEERLEEKRRERLEERSGERKRRERTRREEKKTYECGILLDITIKDIFYLSK